jgi:hypothetical protein
MAFTLLLLMAATPTEVSARHHAYWLIEPGHDEYVTLLIARGPWESFTPKASSQGPLDAPALVLQTYRRDSIWNNDGQPLKAAVGLSHNGPGSAGLDGRTLFVVPVALKQIAALLAKPEGTVPIHRRLAPTSGQESLIAQLQQELNAEAPTERAECMKDLRIALVEALRGRGERDAGESPFDQLQSAAARALKADRSGVETLRNVRTLTVSGVEFFIAKAALMLLEEQIPQALLSHRSVFGEREALIDLCAGAF